MYGYFKDKILPKKLIAIEDLIVKLFNKNGTYCTKYFIRVFSTKKTSNTKRQTYKGNRRIF